MCYTEEKDWDDTTRRIKPEEDCPHSGQAYAGERGDACESDCIGG